jgi:hypothetical protein
LSGSASPLNNFGGSGCLSFSSGFDISATPFDSNIWAAHCHSQPQHAAATISARRKIASAVYIVVTFKAAFGRLFLCGYLSDRTRASFRRSAVHATPTPIKITASIALKLPGAMQLMQEVTSPSYS